MTIIIKTEENKFFWGSKKDILGPNDEIFHDFEKSFSDIAKENFIENTDMHTGLNYLCRSLDDYINKPKEVKTILVSLIESNLETHKQALNTIGSGFAPHLVWAGKTFLKMIKKID